ncbi:MAG: baseplate J/gp47 family protein [Piscinibacter sp.]|uniref:baseplate J/gp47 family protein n=1 Tax=Piscinibacter sp. TaxID=1903157 RepID=UPI0025895FBE|nr:baseplate J/gp47 family protein [Piscinibacter sp.]MCW5666467.1 baseplate J/gp47 family protein [Piscinibacter sp.]
MAFERPTLAELVDRAAADIEARLPGVDARLRRSNLGVLARVHAGALHQAFGYLEWMARQIMVDTCEGSYLERYASIWGVLRLPASFAEGNVTFTGADGTVVPAATLVQRGDGAQFGTDVDVTIASGTATAAVQALDAGAAGNTGAGTALQLVTPIAGVQSAAVVAAGGLVDGADVESDDALRARVLRRIQQPPNGGSAADYVTWALEVPGVTRAWCYPLEGGAGTVTVRFVRDDDASIIPDAGEVAAVQAYIAERRPVTANVTVAAPTAVPLNLTIQLVPNTAEVKAAVTAELLDLLRREAQPGGTILISHIREAISVAAGETNHVLTVPSADVTHTAGQIATLGTITWS